MSRFGFSSPAGFAARRLDISKAFSSEVGTGSREENASNIKKRLLGLGAKMRYTAAEGLSPIPEPFRFCG
jgi:hypothetical protein